MANESKPANGDNQEAYSEYCEAAPMGKLRWRNLWERSTDYRTYRLNLVTPLRCVLRECGFAGRIAGESITTWYLGPFELEIWR